MVVWTGNRKGRKAKIIVAKRSRIVNIRDVGKEYYGSNQGHEKTTQV